MCIEVKKDNSKYYLGLSACKGGENQVRLKLKVLRDILAILKYFNSIKVKTDNYVFLFVEQFARSYVNFEFYTPLSFFSRHYI